MASYWNALCDLLNQAWQAEVRLLGPEYQNLCEQAEAVRRRVDEASRNTQALERRTVDSTDATAGEETLADRLVQEHRETWRRVAALRRMRRTDPVVATPIKAVWDGFERHIKTIGASSGCHESNRAHVADTFRLALRRLRHGGGRPQKKFIDGGNLLDPASINRIALRHRFGGGGIPVLRCFSDAGGLFHLNTVPDDAYASNARSARHRRRTSGQLRLRIGTAGQTKAHLVISFGAVLHRPLPKAGIVKLVQLSGRRSFGTWSWRLNITLEEPSQASIPATDYRPIAGLDLNWRHIWERSEIRFGALVDSAGQQYFLTLPLTSASRRRRFSDHAQLAELQKHCDHLLEQTKVRLSALLMQRSDLPDAVATWAANITKMGRRGLLSGLSLLEQSGAVPEAETLLRCQWLVEDERIRKRLLRLSGHLIRRRTHLYRNIAATLCRRYGIIAIKRDFAVSRVSRVLQDSGSHRAPDNSGSALRNSSRYRQPAAIGAFVRYLEEAARKHGTVVIGTGAFVTVTHHRCGTVVPRARDIELYCDRCGVAFDQDVNAAHNLLSQIPRSCDVRLSVLAKPNSSRQSRDESRLSPSVAEMEQGDDYNWRNERPVDALTADSELRRA